MQFIIKLKLRWASEAILKQLEGNFGDLSMQKYSSNVVEKCLQYAHEVGQYPNIVLELINDPRFDKIMQDPYGNYAIQTALNNTEVSWPRFPSSFWVSMFMYQECVKSEILGCSFFGICVHAITREHNIACNFSNLYFEKLQ